MPDDLSDEQALVQRWAEQARVPAWLAAKFRAWEEWRRYLHTDVLQADDPSKVAVNFLYRAIQAKLALVRPERPAPEVKRIAQVEPAPGDPRAELWARYNGFCNRVAESGACVLRAWGIAEKLDQLIERAALDAMTVGIVWLKTGFQADAGRDRLGRAVRHKGARSNLLRLRRLAREFAAGEWDAHDARHAELLLLSDFARAMARRVPADQLAAGDPRAQLAAGVDGTPAPPHLVPEPQVWRGGTVGTVDPENLRFDWQRVTTPETIDLGRWWQERVWLSRDEVRERFRLTPEEAEAIATPWRTPTIMGAEQAGRTAISGQEDPADTDLEGWTRDGGREVAVWERTDLELGLVCWWVQGIPRILDREVMDAQTRRGHPYLCVVPNPVSGRFLGLSDVELARKEQDALNATLTDDFEARMAAYPFYGTIAGLLSEDDKKAIRNRVPNAVVELSQSIGDIEAALRKFPGEPYNPGLYIPAAQRSQAAIELVVGTPTEALGGANGGTRFATQTAVQSDNMNAQMGRLVARLVDCTRTINEDWLDYAIAMLSLDEVRTWAGPFAEWPLYDRERIARGLTVEVISSGSRANRGQAITDLGKAVDILVQALAARGQAAQQGYDLPLEPLMAQVASALDLRGNGPLAKPIPPQVQQAAQQAAAGMAGGMGAPGGAQPLAGALPPMGAMGAPAGALPPGGLPPQLVAALRAAGGAPPTGGPG